MIAHSSNLARILGWIAAALLALALAIQLDRQVDRPVEFHSYYTASRLVLEGAPISHLYDDKWFRAQGRRLVPGLNEIFNANVPTTALVFIPFALIQNPVLARLAWMLLCLFLLVLFVESLIAIAQTGPLTRPYWYIAALASQPVRTNLLPGQAYIIAGLGLVLALKWWRQNRGAPAGATLAVLLAYKSVGTMLWPIAAAARKWRTVLSGLIALAAIVLVTWPAIGAAGWLAYLHDVERESAAGYVRATAYQSIESLVRHLLSEQDQGAFGAPLLALPVWTARSIAATVTIGFLGATMYLANRHPADDLVVGAGILVSLFAFPLSQAHAYVIAFIPIAQLMSRVKSRYLKLEGFAVFIASLLVLLPLPYKSHILFNGWGAFFAYPKLYGALALWGLCACFLTRRAAVPT